MNELYKWTRTLVVCLEAQVVTENIHLKKNENISFCNIAKRKKGRVEKIDSEKVSSLPIAKIYFALNRLRQVITSDEPEIRVGTY